MTPLKWFKPRRIIVIFGPVCSGKTILASQLQHIYQEFGYASVATVLDLDFEQSRLAKALQSLRGDRKAMLIVTVNDNRDLSFFRRFKKRAQFIHTEAL